MNAASGYAQQVAEMARVTLPLYSERHNILVTELVERVLGPMIMGLSLNIYCQQSPHDSFIMGRTDTDKPRDLRITPNRKFLSEMSRTVTTLLPPLKNIRLLRQRAGLYNISPDKQAIYGEIPALQGFMSQQAFPAAGL